MLKTTLLLLLIVMASLSACVITIWSSTLHHPAAGLISIGSLAIAFGVWQWVFELLKREPK
jgi:hypothetical protein